ncbi:MAG TPA: sigma-70 family RNA polymerase sigma factor [Gemmataceae bacterium]|nr:sigma-70 family RNA polymerase sigma factor [Gemmataceae bacterium]
MNMNLNQISTLWSLVCRAHHGPAEETGSARQQLVERYGGAIRRYLQAVLKDADAADEIFQEFALQLCHGNLRGADPQRGRFRNFVKGTLFHLIADYRRQQRYWPQSLPAAEVACTDLEDNDSDRKFVESWCDELLARAWAALGAIEAQTGQPYHAVLRFRADHPRMRSPQLAEQLSARLGRSFTPSGVRQILHRAREKFAALLLDEVSHSLENPTTEKLEEELVELGLLDYCRPALQRRLSA